MKVTREKAAEHRAAIVKAAGRLFRARGFDKVGVGEITKAAGLTHGGFYGHFASKDALAAEACGEAFRESRSRLPAGADDLLAYIDRYLSERHRDRPDAGCPMSAYATEVGRQDPAVQQRFTLETGAFIEAILQRLPAAAEGEDASRRRGRAIATVSALVGGMALARATAQSDPDLSAEILAGLRDQLGRLVAGTGS